MDPLNLGRFLRLNGLTNDGGGSLWGVAEPDEGVGNGAIFKVREETGAVTVIHSFTRNGKFKKVEQREPLFLDRRGRLWGTNSTRTSSAAVFRINPRAGVYKEMASSDQDPRLFGTGPLAQDEEGNLWCTTLAGAVVKINIETSHVAVVAEFPAQPGSVRTFVNPARMVSDASGHMWGIAEEADGADSIFSFVFKVNIANGTVTIVRDFDRSAGNRLGLGELVNDGAGSLWATAQTPDWIIKVDVATGVVSQLEGFDVEGISFRLLADGEGHLWGTYENDPAVGRGGVFKVNTARNEFIVVAEFGPVPDSRAGLFPGAALTSAADGNLWGVASEIGFGGSGFIYKVDPITCQPTLVVEFTGAQGQLAGSAPRGPLAVGPKGLLWGTARSPLDSQGFVTDFVFNIDPFTGELAKVADLPTGKFATAPLTYDDQGSFWSTCTFPRRFFKVDATSGLLTLVGPDRPETLRGDQDTLVSDGAGFLWGFGVDHSTKANFEFIFKLEVQTGALTRVVSLDGTPRTPFGLCRDGRGNLWGTVGIGPLGRAGGAGSPGLQPGFGAAFKLNTRTGKLTFKHSFPGTSRKGGVFSSALVSDGFGTFYGTTEESGALGLGTIFRFTANRFNTLFHFTGTRGKTPGAHPEAIAPTQPTLVRHIDGNLYGSTLEGGVLADGKPAGGGQFFRLRFGPTPITLPAEEVSSTGAILKGTINPNGKPTGVTFEYGTDPELKTFFTVGAGELPARTKPKLVALEISALQPGETYYFRIVGQNEENTQMQRGAILSFATPAAE